MSASGIDVGDLMAFEQGDLDAAGVLRLFSSLIRTGDAWTLQGSYGRAARALIERGLLTRKGDLVRAGVEEALGVEAADVLCVEIGEDL